MDALQIIVKMHSGSQLYNSALLIGELRRCLAVNTKVICLHSWYKASNKFWSNFDTKSLLYNDLIHSTVPITQKCYCQFCWHLASTILFSDWSLIPLFPPSNCLFYSLYWSRHHIECWNYFLKWLTIHSLHSQPNQRCLSGHHLTLASDFSYVYSQNYINNTSLEVKWRLFSPFHLCLFRHFRRNHTMPFPFITLCSFFSSTL